YICLRQMHISMGKCLCYSSSFSFLSLSFSMDCGITIMYILPPFPSLHPHPIPDRLRCDYWIFDIFHHLLFLLPLSVIVVPQLCLISIPSLYVEILDQ